MSFKLALKSTLDKHIMALVQELRTEYPDLEYADLDGAETVADFFESPKPGLAWSLVTLAEDPCDPLYSLSFECGGRTSNDPAQYMSMALVERITDLFPVKSGLTIMDYSTADVPTEQLGDIYITSAVVAPAQFDHVAGLRLVRVEAQVVRWP